jgi:murein biosynthesis integral membrane protein MurJ
MTTPGSQAGPTDGDSDSADSPDWTVAPGLARPYANPAREYVTVPEPSFGRPAAPPAGSDVSSSKLGPDVELPPGWPGAEPAVPGEADGPDGSDYQRTSYDRLAADHDRAGSVPPYDYRPHHDRAASSPPAYDQASHEAGSTRPAYGQANYDQAGSTRPAYDQANYEAGSTRRDYDRADYDRGGWADVGPGDRLGSETGEIPLPADAWPGPGLETPPSDGPVPAYRTVASAAATQRLPAGGGAGPGDPAAPADSSGSSIVRSSGVMAVGTLASRVTGFVRTAILIYALGTHDLGNAYQLANTVPNAVYNVALGGVLTSVVVPLLVSAARRDKDRGEAYDQRIFTLGVLALGLITVVATAAAAPLTDLYGHDIGNAATHHLTLLFAYFFLPQIFFYGVSSLAGAILNARGRFGAPMWTPVINNVVVIVIGGAFMLLAGLNKTPQNISGAEIQLLGIGTTLGIVAQTAALIPSLRRVGFRWRPRFDFRRGEVSEIGRMGGWMFGYVLTTQASFVITAIVANAAGARVSQADAGAGYAAYSNAWQLFQLPYAIVGISVITAMLPRMSSHAAARNFGLVRDDFSGAARLASVIVVPAALVLAVLGEPLSEALFGYGSTSVASARYLGEIFAVFSLGLLPYMVFQLQLRVFYAMHDSRTPALIGLVAMAVNIAANLLALAILPPRQVVAGLGLGFGLANLTGAAIAWLILSRRIGGLDGRMVTSSLVRMHLASLAPACFAIAISLMVGVLLPAGRLGAFVTIALAGSGGLLLYVMFARALRVGELAGLTETVTARFRR